MYTTFFFQPELEKAMIVDHAKGHLKPHILIYCTDMFDSQM
jgi:hypothetical protein